MVVVNFPHNPTGCLPSQEEWGALVACCRSKGAWLFSDEMYRHLGAPHVPHVRHGGDTPCMSVLEPAIGMPVTTPCEFL